MDMGLNERFDETSVLMENTYIPELPDGTGRVQTGCLSNAYLNSFFSLSESGRYLALDLGGTNFRVILLELENGKVTNEVVKMYHIGSELRIGGEEVAVALFDFIGQCLCDFVEEQDLVSVPLPLGTVQYKSQSHSIDWHIILIFAPGFTFSFPMRQHGLNTATLDAWAKSFNLPTVIGTDVVDRLRDSLHKLGHNHIEVVAILNDTTSTLVMTFIPRKKHSFLQYFSF